MTPDCSEERGIWGEAAVLVWVGAIAEEGGGQIVVLGFNGGDEGGVAVAKIDVGIDT